MKLVTAKCSGCQTSYQTAVEGEALAVACPTCGQNNTLGLVTESITGLCSLCGGPLDDHGFESDTAILCPPADSQ